jgi:transglutaminase-like putative cysteine protease
MKNTTLTLIAFFALTCQSIFAQKNIDPLPEDIALAKKLKEKYAKDNVAILSGTETISFGINQKKDNVTVNHSIKEQLMNIGHRADIRKYAFYDSTSEISEMDIKYRNNKSAQFYPKDEFYHSDDLFYNDYRVKYFNIDFPVQGYTYHFDMNQKFKDVKYFTSVYFNDEYPIVKKEFRITVPDWLQLEIKEFNLEGYQIKKDVKQNPKTKSTVYTYTVENVAATAKEDSAPGPSHVYPHILLIAHSFKTSGKEVTLFNSTTDLYKWYKSLVDGIEEKPELLKAKVKELTANAKTDEEKIKNIYYWVQDNIRYIAFEDGLAGFRPDAAHNVFQKRYGDCKGMANLTKQMLKIAGYDARLTWIGTKRIAYDYTIPSLSVDNHMICSLMLNGKRYFLDGTEKFNSFGEYAERIQGKQVLIEDGDKFIVDKVPVADPGFNKEVFNCTFRIDNEALTGTVTNTYTGESRASFLYSYNNIKNDKKDNALQYYLSKGDKNFLVSNIITSDLANRDKNLSIEYNTTIKNKVSSFENEMYVDLDYFEEFSNLEFTERKLDYEFDFKKDYESTITLEVPQGYKVTKLPDPLKVDNGDYSINLSYEQQGNNILYKKRFIVKNGSIKANDFKNWNQTIKSLKKIYNEQITLTKL